MRLGIALLALAALAACKKSNPPPEPASPAPSSAVPARSAAAPQPAASGKLDPAQLDKYIAYEKALLGTLPKRFDEYRQTLAEAKKDPGSGVQASAALAQANALTKAIDEDKARLQKDSGLSAEALQSWDSLTSQVVELSQMNVNGPLAKMAAAAHARVAQLPPEKRDAAEKQLEAVDEQLKKQQALTDQRAEFGDAAVNAALARKTELTDLHAQRMALLKQMTAAGDAAR